MCLVYGCRVELGRKACLGPVVLEAYVEVSGGAGHADIHRVHLEGVGDAHSYGDRIAYSCCVGRVTGPVHVLVDQQPGGLVNKGAIIINITAISSYNSKISLNEP